MMLTPEQATQAWCPMSRGSRTDAGGKCIADKCMMWRWGETRRTFERKVVELRHERQMVQVPVDTPTRGYCGLAVMPELMASR